MPCARTSPSWTLLLLLSVSSLSPAATPILTPPVGAQTISGRLLDGESRFPIVDGVVILVDTLGLVVDRSSTDSEGKFALRAPGPGRYALRGRGAGYRGGLEPRFDLAAGQEVTTDLLLVPGPGQARSPGRTVLGRSIREPDGTGAPGARDQVAADTTIMGFVRDAGDGRPLPGVFLRIENLGIGATTDSLGSFSLRDVPVGEQILLCDVLGYAPLALPIEVPLRGQHLEVTLQVSPIELSPLEVRIDRVVQSLDARLRASQSVYRVSDAESLRELDDVLDPKAALVKMGLGEGECSSGDCMRMFGKSKRVSAWVNDLPVSFDEFRGVPIRDLCRIEAEYYRTAGSHVIRAYTCAFLQKHAEGLAPVIPVWWPWGRG